MKRALRRHHSERRKRAVTRHARTFGLRADAVSVGIHARTRVPCSCWCCGNPRRHYAEPTMQERAAAEPLYLPDPEDDSIGEWDYDLDNGEGVVTAGWEHGWSVAVGVPPRQCRAREFAS